MLADMGVLLGRAGEHGRGKLQYDRANFLSLNLLFLLNFFPFLETPGLLHTSNKT